MQLRSNQTRGRRAAIALAALAALTLGASDAARAQLLSNGLPAVQLPTRAYQTGGLVGAGMLPAVQRGWAGLTSAAGWSWGGGQGGVSSFTGWAGTIDPTFPDPPVGVGWRPDLIVLGAARCYNAQGELIPDLLAVRIANRGFGASGEHYVNFSVHVVNQNTWFPVGSGYVPPMPGRGVTVPERTVYLRTSVRTDMAWLFKVSADYTGLVAESWENNNGLLVDNRP